jgi:hypothetical protein
MTQDNGVLTGGGHNAVTVAPLPCSSSISDPQNANAQCQPMTTP